MAFWNSADILQPSDNFCKVKISLNDFTKLRKVFRNAKTTFKNLHLLNHEAALLSRLIYKNKSKFHTEKAFHKVEAVNRGLLKYLALDIVSIYAAFENHLPKNDQLTGRILLTQNEISLPSRQMLEWILVRTQGFARLFCYVAQTCEDAFSSWLLVIKRGVLWDLCIMMVSVMGRIWSLARYLIVHACDWYAELLPYHDILKPVSMPWLPLGYKLPQDLKLWLNMPSIFDGQSNGQEASNSEMSEVFKLLGMSEDIDSKPPMYNSGPLSNSAPKIDVSVDLGVSVSRQEFLQRPEMSKKTKRNTEEKSIDSVKKKKPLKDLLAEDSVKTTNNLGEKKKKFNSSVKQKTPKDLLAEDSVKTTDNLGVKKKKFRDLPAGTDSVGATNSVKKKKKLKDLLMATNSISVTNNLEKKKKLKRARKEVVETPKNGDTRSEDFPVKKKKNKFRLVEIKEELQKKTKKICR